MLIVVSLTTAVATFFFFFNDTATTEIYTLSLHDALPISALNLIGTFKGTVKVPGNGSYPLTLKVTSQPKGKRSEEHTSELQSRPHLVCRLLLEKQKPRLY